MDFKHYLHTGFNVPFYTNRYPVEEWTEYRFKIFEDITLPSIINQTCKNFEWIVFFGKQTSAKHREKIQKWEDAGIMTPVWLIQRFEYLPYYAQLKEESFDYLLTSRCDNDDALASHFIQTVQDNFEPANELAIDIVRGCKWIYNSQRLYINPMLANPFYSLIERNDGRDFKIAKEVNHGYIYETIKKVKIVGNTPIAWLRGIHQQNTLNVFPSKDHILSKKQVMKILSNFNITKEPEHEFAEPAIAQWEGKGKDCKYIKTIKE